MERMPFSFTIQINIKFFRLHSRKTIFGKKRKWTCALAIVYQTNIKQSMNGPSIKRLRNVFWKVLVINDEDDFMHQNVLIPNIKLMVYEVTTPFQSSVTTKIARYRVLDKMSETPKALEP